MAFMTGMFKKKKTDIEKYQDFMNDRIASSVFKKNLEKRGLSEEQGRKIFEEAKRLSSPPVSFGGKKKTTKKKASKKKPTKKKTKRV